MKMLGAKPVIGSATETGARLRKRTWLRNSFQQVMTIAISPEGAGARLSCRMGPPIFGCIFLAFWTLAVTVMFAAMLGAVLQGEMPPPALIAPVLFLLTGFGVAVLGRAISNPDGPFLLDFLRRTLDARDAVSPAAGFR